MMKSRDLGGTAVNIYDSIPRLQGFLADPGRNAVGALGERLALLLLQRQGYTVDLVGRGRQRRGETLRSGQGDLRVIDDAGEVIRVEVKTARRCKDGKWRFLLWKKTTKDKAGQDCRSADILLLLAVLKMGDVVTFVIPIADLGARSQICITSHPDTYTGCWSPYRQQPGQLSIGGTFETSVSLAAQAESGTPCRGTQPRNRNNSCTSGTGRALVGTAAGHHGASDGARAAGGHS